MPFLPIELTTFRRIEAYAQAAGIPPRKAVHEALNAWMDTDGEPLMDFLQRKRSAGKRGDASAKLAGEIAVRKKKPVRTTPSKLAASQTTSKLLRMSRSPHFRPAQSADPRHFGKGA